mmetsp:Transcript_92827/g.300277  ORF Transcript_92827/g.300277 Transcript_92827/m.300277 type:complete len:103 (+) Transcript_92827:91-399(+)
MAATWKASPVATLLAVVLASAFCVLPVRGNIFLPRALPSLVEDDDLLKDLTTIFSVKQDADVEARAAKLEEMCCGPLSTPCLAAPQTGSMPWASATCFTDSS